MTTEYNANEVMVTDQAGKVKKSYSDALGRLTSVVEDPAVLNYTTSYGYDVLDNLTSVTQGGQTRTFVYNSLSRLICASNPETRVGSTSCETVPLPTSGLDRYTYDDNGNLLTKTDARGIVTTFDPYDGLNRPTRKSYSDGTPEVIYLYDVTYWGRLWFVFAVAEDFYSDRDYHYDELGRVILSGQYTWVPSGEGGEGQQYWFRYRYKKSGAVETITYPTGRVVTNSYDGAGRLSGVSGYASGIEYAPQGAVNQRTLGNGVAESWTYNGRLQPLTITATKDSNTLLSLTNGYGGANNNGNVVSQTIAPLGVTQLYSTYDGLNRLKTFAEGGLSRSYDHDRYGNRWVPANNGMPLSPQTPVAQSWFEAASNRIVAVEYDEAGNQEQVNPYRMEYDAENRQKSSTLTIGAETYTSRYYYDPEHGRRVAKVTADGTTTVYVYDAFGKLAAEYSNPGPLEPATSYLTADHLGSTRLVTKASGSTDPQAPDYIVHSRHDYLPFGEELFAGTGPRTQAMGYLISEPLGGVRQKFTGKERDAETGLDYFGARYFSGVQGRFTSPDPNNAVLNAQMITAGGLPSEAAQAHMEEFLQNPQNWNRYAYVRNNPLAFVDPFGAAPVGGDGHHLIVLRGQYTGLAREFTEAIKTGGPNVAPNIGLSGPHRAYSAAVEQALQGMEQEFGAARNSWNLSQWKDAATRILNANTPAIRNFLDTFNRNQGGKAIPALAAAIKAYRPSAGLIARTVIGGLGEDLLLLFRMPLIIMVDPSITNPQKRIQEEIKKDRKNCLLSRETGNCIY